MITTFEVIRTATPVDGRIILKWIFRKWERVMGTGWRDGVGSG